MVLVAHEAAFASTESFQGDWDNTFWGGELPTLGWIDTITLVNPGAHFLFILCCTVAYLR